MKRKITIFAVIALFTTVGFSFAQEFKDSAESWQKQAKDTRAQVVAVAEELGTIGDKGNEDAKGLIEDAYSWLAEGDKKMEVGDKQFEEEAFGKSSYSYNMAWQYYVKAATAGLNARRILTGK